MLAELIAPTEPFHSARGTRTAEAMADAKRGAKEPMSELTFVATWRQRIDSEISSQVRFASEWGSLESDSARLPETLEEQIEQKRAEIAA